RHFWTARVDEFGDSLWADSLGGHNNDHANDIVELPSGDFIAVGSTQTFGAGGGDFYVVRLSPEGDTVWTRTWGEDEPEQALAVTPTADACLIVAGWSRTETSPWRPTLVKFTLDGDTAWSRKYYVEGDGGFYDILDLGSDSGYLAVGYGEHNAVDALVFRVSPSGESLWTRFHGVHEADEVAYSIAPTEDGNYYVAGIKTLMPAGNDELWVFGMNSLGNGTGQFVWGTTDDDQGFEVIACSDGGWFASGHAFHIPAGPNCIAIKSVPLGNLIRNGDFRYWRSDVDPFGWFADDTTKASVGQCPDTVRSSPYSMRLTRLVSGAGDDCGVRRLIFVDEGQDYSLTAWILDQSEDAAGGIGISWYDVDTGYISSSATVYTDSGIAGWQALSVSDQAPQNATFADVQVRVYGRTGSQPGGSVLVDDVDLRLGLSGVTRRDRPDDRPVVFSMAPNPTKGCVRFELPRGRWAQLRIYDTAGRLMTMRRLPDGGTFVWDGRDRQGHAVPAGVYFASVRTRGTTETRTLAVR
ncbi:MAG: hypothetical protein JSU73_08045, partial [candidate division WOR-3 bacterium]